MNITATIDASMHLYYKLQRRISRPREPNRMLATGPPLHAFRYCWRGFCSERICERGTVHEPTGAEVCEFDPIQTSEEGSREPQSCRIDVSRIDKLRGRIVSTPNLPAIANLNQTHPGTFELFRVPQALNDFVDLFPARGIPIIMSRSTGQSRKAVFENFRPCIFVVVEQCFVKDRFLRQERTVT
jgi:hypothetical protein